MGYSFNPFTGTLDVVPALTATFVTLSATSTLANERVLTGTANQITITDNGAGSTVVLSLPQNIHTGASPTFAGLTLDALSGVLKASAGVVSGSATTTDLPEGSNQYFTNARAIAAPLTGFTTGAGTVAATDSVLESIQKIDGNVAVNSTSLASAFVTIGNTADLSGERAITAVANQTTLTDNGAGSTLLVGTVQDIGTASTPTFGALNLATFAHFADSSDPATPSADTLRQYSRAFAGLSNQVVIDERGNKTYLNRDVCVYVHQATGGTILKGEVVYFNGATNTVGGDVILRVSKARANAQTTIAAGVAMEDIANNSTGRIIRMGRIEGMDTSAFAVGATLYLSETTAGAMTSTAPVVPNFSQRLARCVTSHATTGIIEVLICEIDGNEAGTSARTWTIGDGTNNTMTYAFRASATGSLQWNPQSTRTMRLQDLTGTVVCDIADATGGKTVQFDSSGSTSSNKLTIKPSLTTSRDAAIPALSANDTFAFLAQTQTFTNKRMTPRVVTGTSGTTMTPTGDTADVYKITISGGNLTIAAPTGTPTDGQLLETFIVQDGTGSRTYTWNAIFLWTADIPVVSTGSGANKKDRFLWEYDSAATKWVIAARNLGQ